jgi:RNA polymerase sigma-70 factor (ECF subfamily)
VSNWNQIVHEHGPMVFRSIWRILGHAADTEDVCQEVFLEAHKLRQAQTVRNWGGLLRRLAVCRALNRLQQRKFSVPLDGIDLPSPDQPPEAGAIEHELIERVRQAIGQLPEREASVFCLRYLEELPYERIAEILNITSGAVATALHKARSKLEALLAETPKGE